MLPTERPIVSTIIPTRNRARLLTAALDSACSQSLNGTHEIIVVDDSSSDDTKEVVANYPSVNYLSVCSGKPSISRNYGIRASSGTFVAFLDDDDVWLPDRFHPALEILENDQHVGMVYGQATMTSHDLCASGPSFPPLPLQTQHPVAAFLDIVIHLNTVLVRRDVLDDVGLLNERVYAAEDMDLTVRIARRHLVEAVQRPLCLIRSKDPANQSQVRGTAAHWLGRAHDDLGLLKEHCAVADSLQPNAKERARIVRRRTGWYVHMLLATAVAAARESDMHESSTAISAALKLSPLHCLKSGLFYQAVLETKSLKSS